MEGRWFLTERRMFLRETWQKEGDIRQIEGLFWDRNLTQRRVFLTEKGLFSERNLTERRHFLTERRTFLSKAWWKDGDFWQKEGCSEGNLTERRRYLTERRSFLREKHDRKKAISDRKKGRFWENPDTKKGISDRKKVFSGELNDLTQQSFMVYSFSGSRAWLDLVVVAQALSYSFIQDTGQGYSHLKAWKGLKDLLPWWLTYVAIS